MNCMLALNREIWDGELCSLKALVNWVARGGKGINFKDIWSANAGTCFQPPCPNKQRAPTIQSSLEVWHLKSIYFDCRKVRIITVSVHLRIRKSCPEHRRHATDLVQSNMCVISYALGMLRAATRLNPRILTTLEIHR